MEVLSSPPPASFAKWCHCQSPLPPSPPSTSQQPWRRRRRRLRWTDERMDLQSVRQQLLSLECRPIPASPLITFSLFFSLSHLVQDGASPAPFSHTRRPTKKLLRKPLGSGCTKLDKGATQEADCKKASSFNSYLE